MKYAREIEVIKTFVKSQRLDHCPLPAFNRSFIQFLTRNGYGRELAWWIQPGYRRLKIWLTENGYSLGVKNRQTIILDGGHHDPELLFLELNTKGERIEEEIENEEETGKQRKGLWDAA